MEITRCLETFHFLGGFCDQPGDRVKSRHVFLAALSRLHKGECETHTTPFWKKLAQKVKSVEAASELHSFCQDYTKVARTRLLTGEPVRLATFLLQTHISARLLFNYTQIPLSF